MAHRRTATDDYLRYYHLEQYLFTDVNRRFHAEQSLSAFDLFSIVVWKANRAKSKVAKRLMLSAKRGEDLDAVARRLTSGLYSSADDESRLISLRCEWKLGLPMASAILSVCWPERFSVYDVRVCRELGDFDWLLSVTSPKRLWEGYSTFLKAIRAEAPRGLSLRECDRYLWGRSAANQLQADIRAGFRGVG